MKNLLIKINDEIVFNTTVEDADYEGIITDVKAAIHGFRPGKLKMNKCPKCNIYLKPNDQGCFMSNCPVRANRIENEK